MKLASRSGFLLALALGLSTGCAESIGVVPCPEGDDCQKPAPPPGREDPEPAVPRMGIDHEIEMTPLTELAPTWAKALPIPDGARINDGIGGPVLDTDVDGNLVLFVVQRVNRGLYAVAIDDDGEATAKIEVAKPSDWNMYPSPALRTRCERLTCVDERGASIDVNWTANCGKDGLETCTKREKIYYFGDLNAAPTRIDVGEGADRNVFPDERDEARYVVEDGAISKIDVASGRTLWTTKDFLEGLSEDEEIGAIPLGGVPLERGRFAYLAQPAEAGNVNLSTFLGFIDEDGQVQRSLQYSLMGAPRLLHTNGRAIAVSEAHGNLVVTQFPEPDQFIVSTFVRDDYTHLTPYAAAVDPSGNIYVATQSGSRDAPKPTLCRAAADGGSGSCTTLPFTDPLGQPLRFDKLIARDGGRVFILSGGQLMRFSYPEG